MFEDEISLDLLWDGPAALQRTSEDRALRSNVARSLLETCGRVRRTAEVLDVEGRLPELAPTPSELRLAIDLAASARFSRPLQLRIIEWVESVCLLFAVQTEPAGSVLDATKDLADALLAHVAPAPADLERWALP